MLLHPYSKKKITPTNNLTLDGKFKLLDGDKIATLAAKFISRLVRKAGIVIDDKAPTVGLVQTAYANGSSTAYAKEELVR